jgi:uncharacterized membrane protein YoaK (UPF0700 family)
VEAIKTSTSTISAAPPPGRDFLHGLSLSFLAGYVDTLGFIALFGLFTAHVTGNFILIGAALADPTKSSVLLKYLAFPAFIAGVALGRLLIAATARRAPGGAALRWSLALQLVLLAGCMVCGMLASPIGDDVSAWAMAAGLLGAGAMCVHSAIGRLLLAQLAPTSMMTGNVTQLVIEVVDMLSGFGDAGTAGRCRKFLWPLVGFAVGAILAAFGYKWFGFAALLLPVAILALLIVAAPRQ